MKSYKKLSILCQILIFIFFSFSPAFIALKMPVSALAASSSFVSTNGTNLYLNGSPYQFTGVNAFNLGSYTGNVGCGNQESNLDTFFSRLRPNSMVRIWAFQGSITANATTKKIDWTGLDRVVNAAQKDGDKLIVVLGDQAGNCDDGHWRDTAWYGGGYTKAINDNGNGLTPLPYSEYIKLVVARYKDSPAIAMWQPINEPVVAECTGATGTACYARQTCNNEPASTKALRSFFDNVGGAIKSIDKNHLVSSGLGGNGQCGAVYLDYQYVNESPAVDVATYHDFDHETQPMPGDQWNGLQARLDQMKTLNKPLMVGEVGMIASPNNANCISLLARRDNMKAKMDAQFKAGVVGFMPWAMTDGTTTACNYNIGDNDPTLTLLHDYPISMGTYQDTLAPTAPNASAKTISPTQIILTWPASIDNVGVVRYDIFRNNVYYTSTTNTSISDLTLTPGAINTYFVKAKDAAGNSSDSSDVVAISTQPTAPTNLTAKIISPTQIMLSWTASKDAIGVVRYDVFRNDGYATSTTDTSVTVTNLTPGVFYSYFVKGKNAEGNSSYSSNGVLVSIQPTPPTNLTAKVISSTKVTLSWNASADAAGVVRYDIFRNNAYYTSTTGISITADNAPAGTTYTYFVKGKNPAGNSSYSSNVITLATPK